MKTFCFWWGCAQTTLDTWWHRVLADFYSYPSLWSTISHANSSASKRCHGCMCVENLRKIFLTRRQTASELWNARSCANVNKNSSGKCATLARRWEDRRSCIMQPRRRRITRKSLKRKHSRRAPRARRVWNCERENVIHANDDARSDAGTTSLQLFY